MATSAYAAAGSVIGGPLGAFIGGAIGAVIDQQVIGSLLAEKQRPPKLGSVDVNYADEGSPVRYAIGNKNQIPGQVIYAGRPYAVSTGGSSKRGEPATTTWKRDVMYLLAGNYVDHVEAFKFDSDLVYSNGRQNQYALPAFFGGKIGFYFDKIRAFQRWEGTPNLSQPGFTNWRIREWHCVVQNLTGSEATELANFIVGRTVKFDVQYQSGAVSSIGPDPVVLESLVTGVNPGGTVNTRLTLDLAGYLASLPLSFQTKTLPSTEPEPEMEVSLYPVLPYPPIGITTLTLTQSGTFWKGEAADQAGSEFRPGVFGALVNQGYLAAVGAANVPALAGMANYWIAGLNISRYGNRVPNAVFTCNESPPTAVNQGWVGDFIARVFREFGDGDPNTIDVSLVDRDARIWGLTWLSDESLSGLLGQLLLTYQIDVFEENGFVRFTSSPSTVTVASGDLGAHPDDLIETDPINLGRSQSDRVGRLHLTFRDVNQDGKQIDLYSSAELSNRGQTENVSLPIPIEIKEGLAYIREMLRRAVLYNSEAEFSLPWRYYGITETDWLKIISFDGFSVNGRDYYVKVEEVDNQHAARLIGIRGRATQRPPPQHPPISVTAAATALPGTEPPRIPEGPAHFELHAFEVPALEDADASQAVVYLAASAHGDGSSAPAGIIYRRSGESGAWRRQGVLSERATISKTLSELSAQGHDSSGSEDPVAVLRVSYRSAVTSKTSSELADGLGMMAVRANSGDWQLVQYRYASDQEADGGMTLTGLKRGLRGTGQEAIYPGAPVVFLDLGVHTETISVGQRGQTLAFAVVGTAEQIEDATPSSLVFSAETTVSRPVASPTYRRRDNGDIAVEFDRRTRVNYDGFSGSDAPLSEITKSFEAVFSTRPGSPISSTTEEIVYTAAMQTTDGYANEELSVTIYQLDAQLGRGQPQEMVIPAVATGVDDDSAADILDSNSNPILA